MVTVVFIIAATIFSRKCYLGTRGREFDASRILSDTSINLSEGEERLNEVKSVEAMETIRSENQVSQVSTSSSVSCNVTGIVLNSMNTPKYSSIPAPQAKHAQTDNTQLYLQVR